MLAGVWCGRGTTGGAGAPRTDGRWVRSWYTNMARKARAAALPMIRKMRIKATVRFPLPALQLGGHVGRGGLSAVGEKVNRSCLVELTVLTRRVVTLPPDRDTLAVSARSLTCQPPRQDLPHPLVEPVQTSVRRGLCAVSVNTATLIHMVEAPQLQSQRNKTQNNREDGSV